MVRLLVVGGHDDHGWLRRQGAADRRWAACRTPVDVRQHPDHFEFHGGDRLGLDGLATRVTRSRPRGSPGTEDRYCSGLHK